MSDEASKARQFFPPPIKFTGDPVDLEAFQKAIKDGYPIGSKVWCCAKILEDVRQWRQAYESGTKDDLTHASLHLGATLVKVNIILGKNE